MFVEEARWIHDCLASLALGDGDVAIDLGSSTETFRRLDQPFIDYYVFLPLRRSGVRVIHVDSRPGEGIDLRYDISGPEEPEAAGLGAADLVVCSNLLEHIRDRSAAVERLNRLVRPNGVLLLTVPQRYRFHADPIDTMYRPSPDELVSLFDRSRWTLLASATVETATEPEVEKLAMAKRVVNKVSRELRGRNVFQPRKTRNLTSCVALRRTSKLST